MDVHMAEASSSTGPPPVVHQATFVFDSGLSRERFAQITETNGVVHKLVQRLMDKCGGEPSLRIGLVITAQDTRYPNTREMHSIVPAYRQDFRRPSSFLTSLPALIGRFTPQGALNRPKPGSLLSDIWDIEDGAGLSITSTEPGPSDYFLAGLIGGLELLELHVLPNTAAPSSAVRQFSPEMALPMLSMLPRAGKPEGRQQCLIVVTDKASLAAIDSDSRGSRSWARDDACASYDEVDWDNIGDRCKAMDVSCSCIIAGSPEMSRSAAPLGRDGATAERLRKMCQTSATDGPDDVWFPLPPDSDVYLSGFSIKVPAPPPVPAPTNGTAETPKSATAVDTPSEAQIKYQMAQKQAMSLKMAQAAQAAGGNPQGGGFNVLAQLISSGRLDPNIMAQLVANARSEDPSLRAKAMQQLSSLMALHQTQKNSSLNAVAQGAAALANNGSSNPSAAQQHFMAAMQQSRQQQQQQQQASQQQGQQQPTQSQPPQQQPPQQQQQPTVPPAQPAAPTQTQPQQPASQNTPTPNAQQLLQQQQQQLLQQQRQAQAAAQQNLGVAANAPGTAGQPSAPQRPNAPRVWSGTLSWSVKTQDGNSQKSVIPVECKLLSMSNQFNPNDLQINQWPSNLEMSGTSHINIPELQNYVKSQQAPCVLFTNTNLNDAVARSKMSHLTMMLGKNSLCAFIRFGAPGCGILLISSNAAPSGAPPTAYRLLGVVCVKTPFMPILQQINAPQQQQQQQTVQPQQATPTQSTQQNQPIPQPTKPQAMPINGGPLPFPGNLPASLSPQQLVLLQQQHQQQQQMQQQSGQQQDQARTPSQNLGQTPTQTTPQQNQQPRLPSQPQMPSTLSQFASNQTNIPPNIQQQLQLRQMQIQQQAQQAAQQVAAQQQQQQQPQPQHQQQPAQQQQQLPMPGMPQAAGGMTFTPQQRMGIVKLLRESGIAVPDSFDPTTIPREQLAAFIARAKERSRQQAAAKAQQPQAQAQAQQQVPAQAQAQVQAQQAQPGQVNPVGQAGQVPQGNTAPNMGYNNFMANMQAGMLGQQGQPQNTLAGLQAGLQLGNQFQQFQQQPGQANSMLGLFAAGQGVNPQSLSLGQFQQHS